MVLYKPILLLILLLGLIHTKTQAQNDFAPIGTTWYYETNGCLGSRPEDCGSYIKYESVRDTTVLGQNCRIIQAKRYTGTELGRQHIEVVYGSKTGKVYWYNFDKEIFLQLYDFGATVGDIWTISDQTFAVDGFWPDWEFDSFIEEVVSIESIEIAGISRKVIVTTATPLPSTGNSMVLFPFGTSTDFPVIEGIGSTANLFGTSQHFIPMSLGNYGLRCFQSEGIEYKHRGYHLPCDYYSLRTSLEEELSAKVRLYPNPSTNKIQIQLPQSAEVYWQIYDAQGKALKQGICTQETEFSIEVAEFSKGNYYIDLIFNHQFSKTLKFIKQ